MTVLAYADKDRRTTAVTIDIAGTVSLSGTVCALALTHRIVRIDGQETMTSQVTVHGSIDGIAVSNLQ